MFVKSSAAAIGRTTDRDGGTATADVSVDVLNGNGVHAFAAEVYVADFEGFNTFGDPSGSDIFRTTRYRNNLGTNITVNGLNYFSGFLDFYASTGEFEVQNGVRECYKISVSIFRQNRYSGANG